MDIGFSLDDPMMVFDYILVLYEPSSTDDISLMEVVLMLREKKRGDPFTHARLHPDRCNRCSTP